MRKIFVRILIALSIAALAAVAAHADAWKEALAAYEDGRFEEAIPSLTTLAEAGHIGAMDRLSHIYWYGDGTPVDYKRAAKWSFLSAARGSPAGAHDLGVHYVTGNGVAYDEVRAVKWMLLALRRGDPHAKGALYDNYMYGDGLPRDEKLALKYLRAAAYDGMASAQERLGTMLLYGALHVTKAPEEGIRYLQLAGEQWEIRAQLFLATAYLTGFHGLVDPDPAHGARWAFLALEGGDCPAADNLITYATLLIGPEAVAQASAEAEAWADENPLSLHLHDEMDRAIACVDVTNEPPVDA